MFTKLIVGGTVAVAVTAVGMFYAMPESSLCPFSSSESSCSVESSCSEGLVSEGCCLTRSKLTVGCCSEATETCSISECSASGADALAACSGTVSFVAVPSSAKACCAAD